MLAPKAVAVKRYNGRAGWMWMGWFFILMAIRLEISLFKESIDKEKAIKTYCSSLDTKKKTNSAQLQGKK